MPIPTPKQNKSTQMQRAREHYIAVAQRAASLSSELNKLYEVLGEAQNEPPQGIADGSISEDLWTKLSEIAKVGREFCVRIEWLRKDKI